MCLGTLLFALSELMAVDFRLGFSAQNSLIVLDAQGLEITEVVPRFTPTLVRVNGKEAWVAFGRNEGGILQAHILAGNNPNDQIIFVNAGQQVTVQRGASARLTWDQQGLTVLPSARGGVEVVTSSATLPVPANKSSALVI
jgi:hypothetical protein